MKLALVFLALSLPAFAATEGFYDELQADRFVKDHLPARVVTAQARDKAWGEARMAMNDGLLAGGAVMRALQTRRISVVFAAQKEPAKTVVVDGHPLISLSDALPPNRLVYGPLVAAEIAKTMFTDMPDCAERSYMRSDFAARVFYEMGGSFKDLPMVEGSRADAVRAAVYAWIPESAETAIYELGRAEGVPSLLELEQKADPKTADALRKIEERFNGYLVQEAMSGDRRTAFGR